MNASTRTSTPDTRKASTPYDDLGTAELLKRYVRATKGNPQPISPNHFAYPIHQALLRRNLNVPALVSMLRATWRKIEPELRRKSPGHITLATHAMPLLHNVASRILSNRRRLVKDNYDAIVTRDHRQQHGVAIADFARMFPAEQAALLRIAFTKEDLCQS